MVAFCESGYEMTQSGCTACPIGSYKSNVDGLFGVCQNCPLEYVTEAEAATALAQCNISKYILDAL